MLSPYISPRRHDRRCPVAWTSRPLARWLHRWLKLDALQPSCQTKHTHPATRAMTWTCSGVDSGQQRKALWTMREPCYRGSRKNASAIRDVEGGVLGQGRWRNDDDCGGSLACPQGSGLRDCTATGGHQEKHALICLFVPVISVRQPVHGSRDDGRKAFRARSPRYG